VLFKQMHRRITVPSRVMPVGMVGTSTTFPVGSHSRRRTGLCYNNALRSRDLVLGDVSLIQVESDSSTLTIRWWCNGSAKTAGHAAMGSDREL
jgi:hypothetical protein